jgi:hypothetical protein
MQRTKARTETRRFGSHLEQTRALLRKARKHRHSLGGTGFYAKAFWKSVGALKTEGEAIAREFEVKSVQDDADRLRMILSRIASIQDFNEGAEAELSRAQTAWRTKLEPSLLIGKSSKRAPTDFLASELRSRIPGFLRNIFDQIQGCFAYEFWDACLVMLRKLVESLIIEGYETAGRGSEIKANGEYQQLGDLVGKAKSGALFRLSRDSKSAIDTVKKFGDNAAHGPRFHANRSDVVALRTGSTILLQDMLTNLETFRDASGALAAGTNAQGSTV